MDDSGILNISIAWIRDFYDPFVSYDVDQVVFS